nr:MAG TPA: hypothetical protein [Caudoviricetes sp.]
MNCITLVDKIQQVCYNLLIRNSYNVISFTYER